MVAYKCFLCKKEIGKDKVRWLDLETICEDCVQKKPDNIAECEMCGNLILLEDEDTVRKDGKAYCSKCYEEYFLNKVQDKMRTAFRSLEDINDDKDDEGEEPWDFSEYSDWLFNGVADWDEDEKKVAEALIADGWGLPPEYHTVVLPAVNAFMRDYKAQQEHMSEPDK